MKNKILLFIMPFTFVLIITLGAIGIVFADEIFVSDRNSNLSPTEPSSELDHIHTVYDGKNTVTDEFIGYCGNTVTKIGSKPTDGQYVHPILYEFWGDNSVEATDILRRLDYKAEEICDCDAEFIIETEIGKYEISTSGAYARALDGDKIIGQVALTAEQIAVFEKIINEYFLYIE